MDTTDQRSGARRRVIIEGIWPQIDCGRWPIKRIQGDTVVVEADLVADGHDVVRGQLRHRRVGGEWRETPMTSLGNDRFRGAFTVTELSRYEYTVLAWVDPVATWRHGLDKKLAAEQDVDIDLRIGGALLAGCAARASGSAAQRLSDAAARLANVRLAPSERIKIGTSDDLIELCASLPDLERASAYEHLLPVTVHPPRARFSSWYEFFPRSFGPPGKHGTFRDAEAGLEHAAALGFDVVYLPPIHPIGVAHRKGRNNSLQCTADDPGSPWAIGSKAGGHDAIHPELGDFGDFDRFLRRARELGLEVALDIAFQASPDHPWVTQHPDWFVRRPDGTIQYAENPPKKYQDIYPLDFDSSDWQGLWRELRGVFEFWIDKGVRVFRVDNPHTKSLRFWAWCLSSLYDAHPDVIFLSEAFTRPKTMYALAKLGFTQSYTYFTWRNSSYELREYLTELTRTGVAEYFTPNFWPNTPDILPDHLQHGGRAAFIGRLVLAATLTSSYGMYGPAYELMDNVPRPGSGENIDNEKYQLKAWDLHRPDSLRHIIARINRIRSQHPALHDNRSLTFHGSDNDQLLVYSKRRDEDVILVVVNLDWWNTQASTIHLDLGVIGVSPDEPFEVHDLVSDARYHWSGPDNYVELSPHMPAHIFHLPR